MQSGNGLHRVIPDFGCEPQFSAKRPTAGWPTQSDCGTGITEHVSVAQNYRFASRS